MAYFCTGLSSTLTISSLLEGMCCRRQTTPNPQWTSPKTDLYCKCNASYLQHVSFQPPQEMRLQEVMQLLNLLRTAEVKQCNSPEIITNVYITLSRLINIWLIMHGIIRNKRRIEEMAKRSQCTQYSSLTHVPHVPGLPLRYPQTHLGTLPRSCNQQKGRKYNKSTHFTLLSLSSETALYVQDNSRGHEHLQV